MIRSRLCVLVCLLAAAPAAAQDKKPAAISLKQAIDELDTKFAEVQGELPGRVGAMLKADSDAEKEAMRAFKDRHRFMLETETNMQRLLTLQAATGKGPAFRLTVEGWLQLVEKSTPKLPPPAAAKDETDYSAADKRAAEVPVTETKSVPRLAQYLTTGLKTDKEKARAIYTWITSNIVYDMDGYQQNATVPFLPDQVLATQCTICDGYSRLYASLASAAGLPAVKVTGLMREMHSGVRDPHFTSISNGSAWKTHSWVAVKLDGKMCLMEPTWGASGMRRGGKIIQAKYYPDHFMVPAEAAIYTHLPADPRWQLLKAPLGKNEMEALPFIEPGFFRLGLKIGNAPQPTLLVRDSLLITLEIPPDFQINSGIVKNTPTGFGNFKQSPWMKFEQARGQTIEIRVNFPDAGSYHLLIYGHKKEEKSGARIIMYRINALGGKVRDLPTFFNAQPQGKGYVYWPLTQRLATEKPQIFAVSVPGAEAVQITNRGKRTPLQKRGDLFVGEVSLISGGVQVHAAYANGGGKTTALFGFLAE